MILQHFPPMGVYETLFKFADATNTYMGEPGTHPWAQGFPLTKQLPDGPPLPSSVTFDWQHLKYPKATGNAELLPALANYYNHFYDAGITEDNIAIFAGGRPAIVATLSFLERDTTIAVEETEYTPYFDMLQLFERPHRIVPSNEGNRFRPELSDYDVAPVDGTSRVFLLKSNPCNPTGVEARGDKLESLVKLCLHNDQGGLFDEAYEFFCDPEPDSAMRYIDDIENTNIFVVGAATKGLQVPGLRVGWVVAAKRHIELFRNFSSIAMGGVSRPAQMLVAELLEIERVTWARKAVQSFYSHQRKRYGEGLSGLGVELFTGNGGFYHWGRLPGGLTADEFNQRLFEHRAGILPGVLCDMLRRRGADGPVADFIRFSFGPLAQDSFESDMKILEKCLR